MDIWLQVANWVVTHIPIFGPAIFASGILTFLLPPLIAQTPHAKAQMPRVPSIPTWPGAHFRLWGYAFGREAYVSGGLYARLLLWLFRAAMITSLVGVTTLFVAFVSLELAEPPGP